MSTESFRIKWLQKEITSVHISIDCHFLYGYLMEEESIVVYHLFDSDGDKYIGTETAETMDDLKIAIMVRADKYIKSLTIPDKERVLPKAPKGGTGETRG